MTKQDAEVVRDLYINGSLGEERLCCKCNKQIPFMHPKSEHSYLIIRPFWQKYWFWCLSCLQTEMLLPENSDEESTTLSEKG